MFKRISIIAISMLLAAGCFDAGNNRTADSADPQAGSSNAEPQIPDDTEAGNASVCANHYYPIDSNTKLKFRVTGDAPGEYVLSQQEVKPDSFTELRNFGSGLEVKVNWICTEDGLRTAEFTNTASFMKGNFDMETIESSGITLPKEWSVGKTWEASYKVKANINAGPAKASANGTVNITNRIVSMDDKIDVDGKALEAAKVESVMKLNLSMRGRKIPSTDVKMTNWYTKNIGLVKQSASTQFGKTGIEYVGKE